MLERLVEFWLDSVNERTYQPAFVQMLVNDGHRVVHSTRHAPIELGKDIISIAPDKVPCAYQLKGNPGARLTLAQLRTIQPQLQELVTMAIPHPAVPNGRHRSYLVTNGGLEEEAQLAITSMNRTWEQMGYGPNALEVLDRSWLLKKAEDLGTAFWPFDIRELHELISMLSCNGADKLPQERMHELLSKIYQFTEKKGLSSKQEIARQATSAAILVSVATRNFALRQNHFALVTAWVMYIAYTIGACARAKKVMSGQVKQCVDAARQATFDSLSELIKEAREKEHLIEGTPLVDGPFYHGRVGLIYGLASAYWLWCKREGLTPSDLQEVEDFLPMQIASHSLWGEGAIPQLLAHYWTISKRSASWRTELVLAQLLGTILTVQEHPIALASPYFPIESVIKAQHGISFADDEKDIGDSDFRFGSYFAEGLLHLAVRAPLKNQCKDTWPDFTRTTHHQFEVEEAWQYCRLHSTRGLNRSFIPPSTMQWTDLQALAADIATPKVPAALRDDPIILLLYLFIAPFRATPDVIRYLGWCFSEIWHLPQPRP